MSQEISRRRILSTSASSLAITGIAAEIGTVSADNDCQDPDWLEDGSVGNFNEEEYLDYATLTNGWVNSTLYMFPMFTNGEGDELYHMGTAVCGFDNCGSGNYDAFLEGQGTKIEVTLGTLYANMDPDDVCVWPDTAGPAQDTDVAANIAWTAFKGAVGLINPTVGAGVLAADLMETAIFTDGHTDDLDNGRYYAWGHTNGEWSDIRHNMIGHFVDFFVKPPDSLPSVVFNIHHYMNTHERNIYDSIYNPSYEVEETYEAYQWTEKLQPASEEKTQLSQEEIDNFGLPDEFVQDGPVYRHSGENIAVESINSNS